MVVEPPDVDWVFAVVEESHLYLGITVMTLVRRVAIDSGLYSSIHSIGLFIYDVVDILNSVLFVLLFQVVFFHMFNTEK